MPYAANLTRLVAGGRLFGPTGDDWATTLHLQNVVGNTNNPPIAAVAAAFEAWFTSANARISQSASLNFVKANRINPDGKYSFQNTNETSVGGIDGRTGAAAGLSFPQISVAVSLLTQKSRGYASRGRFYPPMNAVSLTSEGHISPGQCTEMANAATTLMTALSSGDLAGWKVVVASQVNGATELVDRIAVGDVVDNQRRRRQSLKEAYTTVPVVQGGAPTNGNGSGLPGAE